MNRTKPTASFRTALHVIPDALRNPGVLPFRHSGLAPESRGFVAVYRRRVVCRILKPVQDDKPTTSFRTRPGIQGFRLSVIPGSPRNPREFQPVGSRRPDTLPPVSGKVYCAGPYADTAPPESVRPGASANTPCDSQTSGLSALSEYAFAMPASASLP